MVWPCSKVKDNPTGHSERKTEEEMGKQYQEWIGMDFASSARAAENGTGWKGVIANPSVVPQRPSNVMGENENRIEIE